MHDSNRPSLLVLESYTHFCQSLLPVSYSEMGEMGEGGGGGERGGNKKKREEEKIPGERTKEDKEESDGDM